MNPHGWRRCSCVAAAILWPGVGIAELRFSEWAGAQLEYNSNVFEVSDRQEGLVQNGTTEVADLITRYQGGGQVEVTLGQQKLRAVAEGAKLVYQEFKQLDHYEHHWAGSFDWKLASVVDGQIEYRDDVRLASFADVDTSVLTLQTDRAGSATLNVLVTPSWRVESGVESHISQLPLPNDREFQLSEDSAYLGLKYISAAKLSAGLVAEGARGEYTGLANDSTFDVYGLRLETAYVVSDLSTMEAELGAVERTDQTATGADQKVTALEAQLAYKRTISAKTTAEAELFRRVESYVAGANALIETGLAAALGWQATDKIAINGRAAWTQSDFETGPESDAGRKDEFVSTGLSLTYRMVDWLLLRVFTDYRDRSSNIVDEDFAASVSGVELRLQFEQ